jgi:RNA polymerase sigma-70 factor, ECF subfamily
MWGGANRFSAVPAQNPAIDQAPDHNTSCLRRLAAKYFVTFLVFRDSVGMDGRPTTFHELYDRYAGDVYRFAHWLTGNPHDARDITSETFVRAWTAPEEPRMETVKAYLFTIARNLHRKQWRRQSRFEALDEAMPDQSAQPDEAAVNQDEFRRTLDAIHALPEIDRTVILLRAEQELSYEDIAESTGLSVSTVKVRVFRARAKLAALLHPKKKE